MTVSMTVCVCSVGTSLALVDNSGAVVPEKDKQTERQNDVRTDRIVKPTFFRFRVPSLPGRPDKPCSPGGPLSPIWPFSPLIPSSPWGPGGPGTLVKLRSPPPIVDVPGGPGSPGGPESPFCPGTPGAPDMPAGPWCVKITTYYVLQSQQLYPTLTSKKQTNSNKISTAVPRILAVVGLTSTVEMDVQKRKVYLLVDQLNQAHPEVLGFRESPALLFLLDSPGDLPFLALHDYHLDQEYQGYLVDPLRYPRPLVFRADQVGQQDPKTYNHDNPTGFLFISSSVRARVSLESKLLEGLEVQFDQEYQVRLDIHLPLAHLFPLVNRNLPEIEDNLTASPFVPGVPCGPDGPIGPSGPIEPLCPDTPLGPVDLNLLIASGSTFSVEGPPETAPLPIPTPTSTPATLHPSNPFLPLPTPTLVTHATPTPEYDATKLKNCIEILQGIPGLDPWDFSSSLLRKVQESPRSNRGHLVMEHIILYLSLAELDSDHNPVLVNLGRAVSFIDPPEKPNLKRTDWDRFANVLRERLGPTPTFRTAAEIDHGAELIASAIKGSLEASTPRHRPKRAPQASLPDSILRHVREKNRLRKAWQVSRDPVDKANWSRKVHAVREMVREYRNSVWEDKIESLCVQDRSLWQMTRNLMRVPAPRPPIVGRNGVANSDKEKADALAEHLEAQFVPADNPSDPVHVAHVAQVIGAVSLSPSTLGSLQLILSHPAVTVMKPSVEGLKVAKGVQQNPRKFIHTGTTCFPLDTLEMVMLPFTSIDPLGSSICMLCLVPRAVAQLERLLSRPCNYLRFVEDNSLQSSVVVDDGELHSLFPRVHRDEELRFILDVGDANYLPGTLGQFPRPECADERELIWQSQRENISGQKLGQVNSPGRISYVALKMRVRHSTVSLEVNNSCGRNSPAVFATVQFNRMAHLENNKKKNSALMDKNSRLHIQRSWFQSPVLPKFICEALGLRRNQTQPREAAPIYKTDINGWRARCAVKMTPYVRKCCRYSSLVGSRHGDIKQGEISVPVEAVSGLHAVRPPDPRHSRVLDAKQVQLELSDEVEGLQIILPEPKV
uniref:Uncharacterized protein n=1 Tax=Timema douglasi TaxID=61478 RepID=A0A7R8VJ45_TIMDO|nr:unnamed protein product [Timema douglasi]